MMTPHTDPTMLANQNGICVVKSDTRQPISPDQTALHQTLWRPCPRVNTNASTEVEEVSADPTLLDEASSSGGDSLARRLMVLRIE